MKYRGFLSIEFEDLTLARLDEVLGVIDSLRVDPTIVQMLAEGDEKDQEMRQSRIIRRKYKSESK